MGASLRAAGGVLVVGVLVAGVSACGSSTPTQPIQQAVVTPSPANPSFESRPAQTAVITLGDSYISGEAGRWYGNATHFFGDRLGTDRAYDAATGQYLPDKVYIGGSYANGCNRSDVSESASAGIKVDKHLNIACSGAETQNVLRAAAGGKSFKGEQPQDDQLAELARIYDIKAVVLSIGGNDLGFGDIIGACVQGFLPPFVRFTCHDEQQKAYDKRLPTVKANLGKVLDDVKATMAGAGYKPGEYKFIFQSYPAPIPAGADNRYPEWGYSRVNDGGCPLFNSDSDWAHNVLVNGIADTWKQIAAGHQAQYLDLRQVGKGHEVCATTASHSTGSPNPVSSEWFRFLTVGVSQGQMQESLHPNAYAQKVLGVCLTKIYGQKGAAYQCTNTPGQFLEGIKIAAEK